MRCGFTFKKRSAKISNTLLDILAATSEMIDALDVLSEVVASPITSHIWDLDGKIPVR